MKFGFLGAAATVALLFTVPANAATIFQSISDLAAAPAANGLCSQCNFTGIPDGQDVGESFTLVGAATATTASFDVSTQHFWPTAVTLSIFQDGGTSIGTNIFSQTYTTFLSDVSTGFDSDVVTVDLGSGVSLAAGNYLIFITNPDNLGLPVFSQSPSHGVHTAVGSGATSPPASGTAYLPLGDDIGVGLYGVVAVPEPATWAMMLIGFGSLGAVMRHRRRQLPLLT